MKGVLKSIGGLFVEVNDKPIPKVVSPPPTNVITEAVQITSSIDNTEYQSFIQSFTNILAEENKRNYPGNDYYEFKAMKDAMGSLPDEVKYKAAFGGWSISGGNQTKEALISTANIYLGLVDKEIQEFETAYKAQYDAQVVKNEQLIQTKTKEIDNMVQKINTLNAEVASLKQENLSNTSKLTQKHVAFEAASNNQRNEILQEIDNIKKYL